MATDDVRLVVDVTSKSKVRRCQILVNGPKEANEVKARVRREGVWEARDGVRYQFIAASSVGRVRVLAVRDALAAARPRT